MAEIWYNVDVISPARELACKSVGKEQASISFSNYLCFWRSIFYR